MGPQTNQNSPAITPVITPEPAGTVQNGAGPVVLEQPLKVVQETPKIEQNSAPDQAEILDPHESLEAPTVTTTVATQTIDATPTDASGAPTPTASTTPEVVPGATPTPKPPKKKFSLRDREANRLMFRIVGASLLSFILLVGAGYFVRRITNRVASPASLVSEQDVDLGKKSASSSTLSLASSANTLVVNGNVLTKGSLQVGNGTAYGEISFSGTTGGQKYELPNASGTFCLSVNNCGFARNADIVTTSIAGASGVLTLGTGLALNGTVITNTTSQTEVNGATGAVTIQGTANQVTVNTTNGVVTITTAQDIANTSSPTFSSITLTNVGTQNGFTLCDISNNCGYAGGGASFVQNGNSFGTTAVLGTNDNNSLAFETNGITRLTLDTNGSATLASGRFYAPAGSGSNPTYSFTGDTGLGMYRISASTLGFSTGGGEALRINGQGAVGIRATTLGTNNALTLNTSSTVDNLAVAQFNSNSAILKPLVVQGYTAQTANLQEWQNSAGTVLSSMSADGRLSVGTTSQVSRVTIAGDGTSAEGSALLVTSSVTNGNGSKGIKLNVKGGTGAPAFAYGLEIDTGNNSVGDIGSIRGINLTSPTRTSTGNITAQQAIYIENQYNATWNPNAYAIYQASSSDRSYFAGNIGIANATPGNRLSVRTPTTADATASALIATGATGNKGLVIQGVAGQTANMQEWQGSTGVPAVAISAAGNLRFHSDASNYASLYSTGTGGLVITTATGGDITVNPDSILNLGVAITGQILIGRTTIDIPIALRGATTLSVMNPASKVLVVRGAASQTANLQEWQDSTGSVLASINSSGFINSPRFKETANGVVIGGASTPIAGVNVLAESTGSSNKVLVVKGYTGQTANLQEWQNSAGTALATVSATGSGSFVSVFQNGSQVCDISNNCGYAVAAGSAAYIQNNTTIQPNSNFAIQSAAAGSVGGVIRGAVGQTANLQEWQDSSGTVLNAIKSDGAIAIGSAPSTTGAVRLSAQQGIFARNFANNGDLRMLQFTAGNELWVGGGASAGLRLLGGSSAVIAEATFPSVVGFRVQGAASQTANLQEWQNSSGTTLASVSASGTIYSQTYYSFTGDTDTSIYRNGPDQIRINVGGNDRVQLDNSSVLINNKLAVANSISAGGPTFGTAEVFRVGVPTTIDNAAASILSSGASVNKGLVVQGAGSQTANLQEWQNSSGNTLAQVSSDGSLTLNNTAVDQRITFTSSGISAGNILWQTGSTTGYTVGKDTSGFFRIANAGAVSTRNLSFNGADGLFGINSQYPTTAALDITVPAASRIGILVRGAALQTANLQEWQNSSGTALMYVGATGLIGSNATGMEHDLGATPGLRVGTYLRIGSGGGGASAGVIRLFNTHSINWRNAANSANIGITVNGNDTLQLGAAATTLDALSDTTIGTSATTRKGLVIQGVASQTANLQEWQGSTGAVLVRVTSAGVIENSSTLVLQNGNGGNIRIGTATDNLSHASGQVSLRSTTLSSQMVFSTSGGTTGGDGFRLVGSELNTGDLVISSSRNFFQQDTYERIRLVHGDTAGGALQVRAVSGTTANLQEWLNSSGTVLTSVKSDGSIALGGANTATTGAIRLASNTYIVARNAANSGDKPLLGYDSGDNVVLGGSGTSGNVYIMNATGSGIGVSTSAISSGPGRGIYQTGSAVGMYHYNGNVTLTPGASSSFATVLTAARSGTNVLVRTAATTDIGLVVKGTASQTANLQEWQNSTGTVLASISAAGNLSVVDAAVTGTLTVTGAAIFNNTLTVNGHIISGNTSGTTTIAVDTAGAGTGATASISGNDTSGVITINTGTGAAVGNLGTVTFANAYGSAPNVVITPKSIPGGGNFPQYHFDSGTTTFTLKAFNALTDSATYTFSYQVIQ
ncbi:MAG: trimeric autotransporter adhesin [Patescibacteria group bacterium]|nr:trimeric autotransporter adhesin [Patescibacteria group bacterium]